MNATATELGQAVGRTGTLTTAEGLRVEVRVLDARKCWDRYDLEVTPVTGAGTAWVAAFRVLIHGNAAGTPQIG